MKDEVIVKIAHVADCHLRQRQYGYPQRGEDFLNGLISAINKAHECGCKYILVAGDLLDSTNPGAAVCIDQLDLLHELVKKHKMCMLVTSGNHDKTYPSWCSRFNKFYKETEGGIKVIDDEMYTVNIGNTDITIYGLPFLSDADFREVLPTLPSADILVWHAAIKEFTGYPTENAITCAELNCGKWKLVAMGDQHINKVLVEGETTIAYPGSTELCSSSEEFEKSILIYEFKKDKTFNIVKEPFETRKKQLFIIKTEEELEKAIKEFDPKAVIFVKYNRDINNAAFLINKAIKSTNILRAVPFATTNTNTSKITVDELKDPVSYLRETLYKIVKDKNKAQRIENLCVTGLTPGADFVKELSQYCELHLDKTIV